MTGDSLTGDRIDGALDKNQGWPVLENLLQPLVKIGRPPNFCFEKRLKMRDKFFNPRIVGDEKNIQHSPPLQTTYLHMQNLELSIVFGDFPRLEIPYGEKPPSRRRHAEKIQKSPRSSESNNPDSNYLVVIIAVVTRRFLSEGA
ncbi:MAG TPA: hypothetical protein PLI53_00180, partial [Geobacteraceae bacterium]|nr:hypothetical protein [Geobacteraceae bacterium]